MNSTPLAPFARTLQLIGPSAMERLTRARVAVVGLGAVGSYATEALARAGIGELHLFDHDVVGESNRNRQLFALASTLGQPKAEVARRRVLDINPHCRVVARQEFVAPQEVARLLDPTWDALVDAIDGVNAKVHLIAAAVHAGIPVVSSMGAAAKVDPSQITTADLARTRVCPLAQVLRKRLRRLGIASGVRCVFSLEPPQNTNPPLLGETAEQGVCGRPREPLGSISYLTGIFGLMAAAEVIRILVPEIFPPRK
ncbi:MAG: UBA/THIF-type binding protein [Desulfomicrobiaceae bacterium]|jgi:tRNA A37 threonylcarbamoyladenosine dehydratase|nr:UBA/THIF-type binding protein [Desulfomicrobiaceae bacterium]